MRKVAKITNIDPPYAIAGGEIVIDCTGFDTREPSKCAVTIGGSPAQIVALGPRRILAQVPETKGGKVEVTLWSGDEHSEPGQLTVGRKLAGDLHPVANPAFDPDDGALFVTRSGSRGEELPVTLFRIDISGDVSEFSGDIPNPTGIAFGPDGEMFVTSRLEGVVYKMTPFKEAVVFGRNLGVATGVAFNKQGLMHVGDRTGTIFKVNGIGEERAWTQVEPSVSAFHLAFGPDESLYIAGPTVTSYDCIWRISAEGDTDVFFKGLGRPQGLAFDRDGNLYVAAALRGRRGIIRISPGGMDAKVIVAGINLVGLAFSASGEMAVVSIDSVYTLPTQIKGTLLTG
jgi:sugar lactone lactonase YvrE